MNPRRTLKGTLLIILWSFFGLGFRVYLGYCPHTVTVYNRATIKVLIYLYNEYDPTVTERVQYAKYILS